MRIKVCCFSMSEMSRGSGAKFSIDDAFEYEDDDPIRVYGTTTETEPPRAKTRYSKIVDDEPNMTNETDHQDDDHHQHHHHHHEPTDSQDRHLLPGVKHARAGILRGDSIHSIGNQSDIDNYSVSTKSFPDKRWWKHPKVRENWRIVLGSFLLLIVGLSALIAGIVIEISHTTAVNSTVFFIAGAVLIIPGAYHVVYICCAVKGKKGFSFYNLPVFR